MDNKISNLFKKSDKYIKIAVFAVLALGSVIGVLNREPWRDEAQAWLIARDCGFLELFKQMTYEGHPALWQLVLFPFAHAGFPFWICYAINSAFYFAFLYLVLYKCPLPLWQRVAGVCACPVFVYSYQARSYMLMFMLLAACAAVYPSRRERPILFSVCVLLLANTHAYAVGAAGGMFLCALIDAWQERKCLGKRRIASILIMFSGFVCFLLQTAPSLGKNQFVTGEVPIKSGISLSKLVNSAFSVFEKISRNMFVTYGEGVVAGGTVLTALVFTAGAFACIFSLRRAAVYFGAVVFPLAVLCLLYDQHAELMTVFLFFAVWVMKSEKTERQSVSARIPKGAYVGFAGCLCVMILLSLPHSRLYIESNLSKTAYTSGSVQVAEFLNREENSDYVIAAEYPPQSTAFVALLKDNKKVWYSYTQSYGSYVSWSAQLRESVDTMTGEKIIENVENNFEYGTPVLVVLSKNVPRENDERLEQVFETVNCPVDESFTVYRFRWE